MDEEVVSYQLDLFNISYQLELFYKDDTQVLDEAYEYCTYLQKPNDAFSDMPVCPFLKAEMEKDSLYVDIWKPDKRSFYELFYEFTKSKKGSALFVCMDTEDIKWEDVDRPKYQKFLQKAIKDTGLKALCLSPYEDFTAAGEATRKKAPYFLINVAGRKHFSDSHKKLMGTRYFDKFSEKEKKKLKVG